MQQLTACPVCAATGFRPVMQLRDHMLSGELFSLVECNNCGLRLLNPRPTADAIEAYYGSPEYVSHSGTHSGLINRLYGIAQLYTMGRKRTLVQKSIGKKRGKLLDIGCGRGLFLHTLQNAGWQVMGLEPNATARAACRAEFGLNVLPMEELAHIPANSMDVITLWHVLEHVHDLAHLLAALKRILIPAGRLLLALPNHTSLDAQFYGPDWAAYDAPRHLYHFSPPAVRELCARHGLILLGRSPMALDAFYVALLSEQYQGRQGRLSRAMVVGLRSWWHSVGRPDNCSSVVYQASLAEH